MRDRRGFTLLEVLLALSLGALVVLVAQRLFAGISDGARRLDDARVALDRQANSRRWLVEAFGSLDVGNGGAGGFVGRPEEVEFAVWTLNKRGAFQRDRVALAVIDEALVARLGTSDAITLRDSVTAVAFDYLLEPGANAVWVREWLSPVSAPLAVRIRLVTRAQVDTLLFVVGPRG